jgi:hypothetical protein
VDLYCFDSDSDTDPNFHFDAGPDPDCHQNDADPYADPKPSFTRIRKYKIERENFSFIHSNASLKCFPFS